MFSRCRGICLLCLFANSKKTKSVLMTKNQGSRDAQRFKARVCNFFAGIFFAVLNILKILRPSCRFVVCLFVITPPLPRDGGMARTAIQVHTVNIIEIWLGEKWQLISNQS